MRKFLQLLAFLLITLTIVSLWNTQGRIEALAPAAGTQAAEKSQASAEAPIEIGGGFTLVDQEGRPVNEKDFHGRLMLVFFGFTHCPNICPITVATMSKTMELLGDKADDVAPIFITVDPDRDTSKVLKDFLANFDSHMIGLTGTPKQIKDVAAAYKAYFAKNGAGWNDAHDPADSDADDNEKVALDDAGAEKTDDAGDDESDEEKGIDHSGFIYMMGRDGKYITHFPYDATPEQIADAIKAHL